MAKTAPELAMLKPML